MIMLWICIALYLVIGFVTSVLLCRCGMRVYGVGDVVFEIVAWPLTVIGSIFYFVAWAVHKLAGIKFHVTYKRFIS